MRNKRENSPQVTTGKAEEKRARRLRVLKLLLDQRQFKMRNAMP